MSRDNDERSRFAKRAAVPAIEVATTTGPNGENCLSCRFKVDTQLPPPNLGKLSQCRRLPPDVVMTQMGPATTFPNIPDWCFSYEAAQAASESGAPS